MILFGRRFKPARWSVLVTAAGVALFVVLGNWQLQRAAYKQAIKDKYESRLAQDYQMFKPGDEFQDFEYRKLAFEGEYDKAHNFLLDNQLHGGRAGYHVLTPLRLADSDHIILVDRGWAPWGERRDPLPAVEAPAPQRPVMGILRIPTVPPLLLGEFGEAKDWPRLIPYVDFDILRAQYSRQLLPAILWLAPEQQGHYVRDWDPIWLPPEKSRAYAVQWFGFAALALLLFVVLNLRKIE